jgi:putative metallohydrolase (TIGR04338 family)
MASNNETYAAEDAWQQMLGMADVGHGRVLTYGHERYEPEGLVKFSGVEDIRAFVAKVLAHIGRDADAITVTSKQGFREARFDHIRREIQIPKRERGGGWALNSVVVLHEVAHYLTGFGVGHEQPFRLSFVRLLEDLGQRENARLLQACYEAHGLGVLASSTTETTIAKIGKVLRQAEAAATEGEREVFLAKAQEMATRHSVTLATARAHQARTEERSAPVARSYMVGEARQRGLTQRVHLITGIGAANSVKFTIYGNNAGVTMYGFAEDIDLTIALYESISVQMVTDCEAYLALGEWKGEKVWSDKGHNWVDITKITARLAFYNSYQFRIGRRLMTARRTAQDEILASEEIEVSDETAVVLRDKEVQVRDAFREATKSIKRTWSGGTITGSVRAGAAGDKAARSAAIGTEKVLT